MGQNRGKPSGVPGPSNDVGISSSAAVVGGSASVTGGSYPPPPHTTMGVVSNGSSAVVSGGAPGSGIYAGHHGGSHYNAGRYPGPPGS